MPAAWRLLCLPLLSCLVIALGTLADHAYARIYTWTDEQGKVHFSDRDPGRPDASQVEPGPTVLVPMHENLGAGKAISETVKPSLTPTKSRKRRREDPQEKQCEKYRRKLETIQRKLRAGYSNDQGNRLRAQRRELSSRLSWECIL